MSTVSEENRIEIDCLITGKLKVNTFLITSGTSAVVIDPGGDPETIITAVKDYPHILLLLTHCHYDHSGAVNEVYNALPQAVFAAHDKCLAAGRDPIKNLSRFLMNTTYSINLDPDFQLQNNQRFNFNEIQMIPLHSTGHSQGHLCYFMPEERLLFCGDLLTAEDIGRHDVPGSSLTHMIEDCKELLAIIPADTLIYPGHGEPISAERVKHTNPHLQNFYR